LGALGVVSWKYISDKTTVENIVISSFPEKLSYFVGEQIETDGLVLTANYKDDSEIIIDNNYSVSNIRNLGVGVHTVEVSYGGCKTSFEVEILPIEVSKIEIISMPDKTTYFSGDYLDSNGLSIKVSYNNGESEVLTEGFSCSPERMTIPGVQKVTVSYEGKETLFDVNVNVVSLEKIEIVNKPTKTSYYQSEAVDLTGLTIKATYNNGTTSVIDGGFTCSPKTLNDVGTKPITIYFSGKSVSYNVSVSSVAVNSIAITSNPSKTAYYVGDTLKTDGLSLRVTYNNGTTKTINSGFTCSPTKLSTEGTQRITLTYGGKSATFNVSVNNVTLSSIAVQTVPTKISYYVGDTLNTNGLTLKATYSNGTTKTINSGFTCSPTNLSTEGTQKITVTYSGKTIDFNVTVDKVTLSSISIQNMPTKTTYNVGDTLNTNGLTLKATYSNGTTKTINSGFTCSPTNLSTAGTQKITVTYGGKTTSFNVSVEKVLLKDLSIYTKPKKTEYYAGEPLDLTGLVLKATYTDGSSEYINNGYTYSDIELDAYAYDYGQIVEIFYGGKSTQLEIGVSTRKGISLIESSRIIEEPDNNFSYCVRIGLTYDLPENATNIYWEVSDVTPNVRCVVPIDSLEINPNRSVSYFADFGYPVRFSGEDVGVFEFWMMQYASSRTDVDSYYKYDGTVKKYSCLITLYYEINGIKYSSNYKFEQDLQTLNISLGTDSSNSSAGAVVGRPYIPDNE